MPYYEKILCCIDGSEESLHAAEQALGIAAEGCEVLLLSVVSEDIYDYEGEFAETLDQGEYAEKNLSEAAARVLEEADRRGLTARLLVDHGRLHSRIVDNAQASGAGLIVLGARQEKGIKRRLIGGTASKVIGYADTDVVVIPSGVKLSLNKVLAATDGSHYGRMAVEKAIAVAKAAGAKLDIVSVVEEPAAFPAEVTSPGGKAMSEIPGAAGLPKKTVRDHMREQAEKAKARAEHGRELAVLEGVGCEIVSPTGKPWRVIVNEIDNLGAGLVVMGSHGRTGLRRLLMGSVTQRVMEHAACPTLVAK
jgi:nucleotide-binding universal stress UspA family protein